MNDLIIIRRKYKNIGWSDKLNFYNLDSGTKIKLKSYNGCLCFFVNKKRIGYKTFTKFSEPFEYILNNNYCPF